jgi:hypothetical protein
VTGGGAVRSDAATTWYVRCLLEKVRAERYPSATELDRLENMIPYGMLGEYIQVLLDKIREDHYPSIWLTRRIQHVIECLPASEPVEELLEAFHDFLDDISPDDFGTPGPRPSG